jgi:uncharacterized protein (UPF0548 family)
MDVTALGRLFHGFLLAKEALWHWMMHRPE